MRSEKINDYLISISKENSDSLLEEIADKFPNLEDFVVRLDYVNKLEQRISQLEEIVYLQKVDSPLDLFLHKSYEFKSTLLKIYNSFKEKKTIQANVHSNNNVAAISIESKLKNYLSQIRDASILHPHNIEPRIFMDVTETFKWDLSAGIGRVVRQLLQAAIKSNSAMPFFFEDGSLFTLERSTLKKQKLIPKKGDQFIWLDATWSNQKFKEIQSSIKEYGGDNIVVVYDIIPITFPELCEREFVCRFTDWFNEEVLSADALICISRSSLEEVKNYINTRDDVTASIPISWFHLGANFYSPQTIASDAVNNIILCSSPYYLTVSTIEPRKGYKFTLDAMDLLWQKGIDIRYVIVGKYGWKSQSVKRRILNHDQFGKRLFWLQDATDADVIELYKNAKAAIFPSIAEGFGLMVIEAAHWGLHTFASDIPIFREIAGNEASYFEAGNSQSLVRIIEQDIQSPKKHANIKFNTWDKSADDLLSIIRSGNYDR